MGSERHHNDGHGGGFGGGGDGGRKNRRGRNRKGKNQGGAPAQPSAAVKAEEGGDDLDSDSGSDADERGEAPPNAPTVAEINKMIEDRNNARKQSDFREADRIRDYLKSRGVMLSDEKGGS